MTRPTGVGKMIKTAFLGTLATQGASVPRNERHGTVQPPGGAQVPAGRQAGLLDSGQLSQLADDLAPSTLTAHEQDLLSAKAADLGKQAATKHLRSGERMAAQLRSSSAFGSSGTGQIDEQPGQIRHPNSVIECATTILGKSPSAAWNAQEIALTTLASYAVAGEIGQEVARSCAEHPALISHQTYTEIVDRSLTNAGIPLRSAQIGAQLRDICLSETFNEMADEDPELAAVLHQACAFFQPSELRIVALLQDTAQPGSTAELRREVIRQLAADLAGDTDNTKRALTDVEGPDGTASQTDTEGPTSGPSTSHSSPTKKTPSKERSPGLHEEATDEPHTEQKERTSSLTFQWALATSRWAVAAINNLQRGSSPQSPGISRLLNEAEQALRKAESDAFNARDAANATAGIVNDMTSALASTRPGPLPELLSTLQHSAAMTDGTTIMARDECGNAIDSLVEARHTIIMQRAARVAENAATSKRLATLATSDALDAATALKTALDDHAKLVAQAGATLETAVGFLEAQPRSRGALEGMQQAAQLAEAASRAAKQITLLAEKADLSLGKAHVCTENAALDAKAALDATIEQHVAVSGVLSFAELANLAQLDARDTGAITLRASNTHLAARRNEETHASNLCDTLHGTIALRSSHIALTERIRRDPASNVEDVSRWTLEEENDRKVLATARIDLANAKARLTSAQQASSSAQQLQAASQAGALALATAASSSTKALDAMRSLEALASSKRDSAQAHQLTVSSAKNNQLPLTTQMRTLRAAAGDIAKQADRLSQNVSEALRAVKGINRPVGAFASTSTLEQDTRAARHAAGKLLDEIVLQRSNADTIAEAIKTTATDFAGPPGKKTIGGELTAPILIAGSIGIRAFRLADPQGAPLDRLTRAQLALFLAADAGAITEWTLHKDRRGPAFAKLLNEHDRANYQLAPALREKDSPTVAATRFASHWLAQAGGFSDTTYGAFSIMQSTTALMLAPSGASARGLVVGAVDFVNGSQQILANLQTTDGDPSRWNQLKETAKDFANTHPNWALVGSLATAAVVGATSAVMVNTNPTA